MKKISLMKSKSLLHMQETISDDDDDDDGKRYHKVRDHRHYTGKFREAVHNICNLRYKTPKEIPNSIP